MCRFGGNSTAMLLHNNFGGKTILTLFRNFHKQFPFLEIGSLIEYFAFYGGAGEAVKLDFFEDSDDSLETHIVQNFEQTEESITPVYLTDPPYQRLLTAIARGDGKLLNIFHRAHIGEATGGEMIHDLVELGIIAIEASREAPLRHHTKQPIKKDLRHYRIQSKARFVYPFYRFWFGFVAPFRKELVEGKGSHFLENFHQHRDRAVSLVFEQLSNLLLAQHFSDSDPLITTGGYWDHYSEYDILATTKQGKVVLGECKYSGRMVCKNELTKLREKAQHSEISVDYYALFSRSGFSQELEKSSDEDLLLFDLNDFRSLLVL